MARLKAWDKGEMAARARVKKSDIDAALESATPAMRALMTASPPPGIARAEGKEKNRENGAKAD